MKLPESISMIKYVIKLIEDKKLSCKPIYALSPMELGTLKIYIKTYLKTGFIWPSKSSASVPIFFDKKLDGSFCLCVNYQSLINLTIKN